ncbi:DUF1541 domain-containing protein, partial [Rothia kristinae]|uniref:DUF1541 domain-containing protein n=1 Tax=Rothia kristinae TaxID=37923 RepID=UPI003F4F3DF4
MSSPDFRRILPSSGWGGGYGSLAVFRESSESRYPVGSHVRLTADHMEGMDGAEATVVGAYDT